MGWYNGGAWSALRQNEIPIIIAELCNALNERRDALGLARETWPTASGSTSSDVSASDFNTLAFGKVAAFTQCYSVFGSLLSPAGGYSTAAHYSGWSKTGTDTGLASEDDLWNMASVAEDAEVEIIGSPIPFFDARPALLMQAAFDRMIYPVVYPGVTVGAIDTWGSNYGPGASPQTSAGVVWNYMLAGDGQGGPGSLNGDLTAQSRAGLVLDDTQIWYSAGARVSREISAQGREYSGVISKQWFTYTGGRYNTTSMGDTSSINIAFGGGSDTVDFEGTETRDFAFTEEIPLDGTLIESAFYLPDWPFSLPFNGSRPMPPVGNSSGEGLMQVFISAKRGVASGLTSGLHHIRQILDISGELTDQA